MVEVLRREEKYPLSVIDMSNYKAKFSAILMPDKFSKNGSYMVRSLYFDTPDDKDFFDKLKEQNLRRKIRLRIYSPYDTKAKLELKQKENIFQKKRSLTISKEDAVELINSNYSVLLKYDDDFAREIYSIMCMYAYKPKSIVEYQRYALMAKENNIRLTFDSEIRATESSFDLFSENLPLNPVFPKDKIVFEVKYDKFLLGYISEIISTINVKNITSSKYCLSRTTGYTVN
ncbi:MAG: polyphosphate polymerase domain-containing protein [Ruminococcaceae bacterium]|nr:polyphosphate polymerase domain-containing protein [Oscillospiraceae bacterium]